MTILVTGGAGFIGSNFVLDWLRAGAETVVTLDALTYAGHRVNLAAANDDPRHVFVHADILDTERVRDLLARHRVRAIVHLAAETHVDRSIDDPRAFVRSNVEGTLSLLEAARTHHAALGREDRAAFRFLHVSTDEVYGPAAMGAPGFDESDRYRPSNPYAASKAAADQLVRAYGTTYGLPATIAICTNNYGPRQWPEKLIPLVIRRALAGESLPVYGDGRQTRDWLHVSDHCRALRLLLDSGAAGSTWHIPGGAETANLDLLRQICTLLDELAPRADGRPHHTLIEHVADRPGHDRRYALDGRHIRERLGWRPAIGLDDGLRATVRWYLDQRDWADAVTGEAHRRWMERRYGDAAGGSAPPSKS